MKTFIFAVLLLLPSHLTAFPLTNARDIALGGMVVVGTYTVSVTASADGQVAHASGLFVVTK